MAGAPLAAALAELLGVAVPRVDGNAPDRGACALFFFVCGAGMVAGAGVVSVLPIVVNDAFGMTGVGSAATGIDAALVVVVRVLPPSKRRSCGQKPATDPMATTRTNAAMPIRNGNPLRACSGAALRSGGRLGLTFPGVYTQ